MPLPDSISSTSNLEARLRAVRHVALDMDGTIYRGGTLFPFTVPFLQKLERLGVTYSFLTNNSSKNVTDYAAHLHKMGIPAEASQIYTSTLATLEYLKTEQPQIKRLFLLGTASMAAEVREEGYELVMGEEEPDAVLVGFDVGLPFERLCKAAWWINRGKMFVASHPDRVCPTDDPTVLIDCGAVCAALQSATGRAPDMVPGKPDPRMLLGLCQQKELRPDQMAMVGDRIYTDVEMARRAGALGVLVLSGEATLDDVAASEHAPDMVMRDLEEFGERLSAAKEMLS